VIFQSEPITDSAGNYIQEKALFYFILNGEFKVSSLKFNKRQRALEKEQR